MEIVYSNFVDLLLEEGKKSVEEMSQIAVEEFGFPGKKEWINIIIDMELKDKEVRKRIKKEDGRYCLSESYDVKKNRDYFLEVFNTAPKDYLEERSYIQKLKSVLETRR
mgnify:CR=1 FL=1|tara:strand:- start:68 stop:394 length:327 start_codon:yes stop_codon:yes gene_type:complete